MATLLAPLFNQRFYDANNVPLVGGKVFTYVAGTSTKTATFTDGTGLVQNQNPIILDARGECSMWFTPGQSYKIVLSPATDTDPPSASIRTIDSVLTPASTVQLTAPTTDLMVGDGVTTIYTLSANPANVNNVLFSLGGAIQVPTVDYTLSGIVITCTAPPPVGVAGFFNYTVALPVGAVDPNQLLFTPVGSSAAQRTINLKLRELVSVGDFGVTGNGTDETAKFAAALVATTSIGKTLFIPPGSYLINSLELPSNTCMVGAGRDLTILKQISGANDLLHTKATTGTAVANNTRNVVVRDMTLQGTVAADGFLQVLHLMFTQGVSDLTIDNVKFSGFRGDGLYIGTGNERGQNPSQVRHNQRVRVRNCYFDGETKNNRNGISVIDCTDAWIENNYFTRCSRVDMPGCIDVEPDSGGTPGGTAAIVRNINIVGNSFYDNAGAAVIAVNFPNALSTMATVPCDICISDNYIDTAALTYTIGISMRGPATSRSTQAQNIRIERNTIRNVSSPFLVAGMRGVKFEANFFSETRYSGELASPAGTQSFDIEFYRNTFYKVAQGSGGGNAVFMYGCENVTFRYNLFDTIGLPAGAYNSAITMAAGGNNEITIEDNTFYYPVVNANAYDVRLDGGTAAIFRHSRNKLFNINGGTVGCANQFIPLNDYILPVMANSWVAYGSPHETPSFWKDGEGIVTLRGTVKLGSTVNGSTILNFPVNYRPGKILPFVVYTAAGLGSVQVENTIGDLQVLTIPGNALVSLNGISFKAEA